MARRVFSFDRPDRFVCGAVGEPGQRTFFLQASRGPQVVSVALEKAQVAVLAERLGHLLVALSERGVDVADTPLGNADAAPLAEPLIEQFRVGTLTLGWDPQRERVIIEARELTDADDEDEDDASEVADADDEPAATYGDELAAFVARDVGDGPDVVRVQLDAAAAHAFAARALAVVQAGRPPCPLCGAPLDPGGHFCPRRNGFTH